jgi:hypothetical protein
MFQGSASEPPKFAGRVRFPRCLLPLNERPPPRMRASFFNPYFRSLSMLKEVPANHSFEVGESYFIKTVTDYVTGRIVWITDTDILLENVAWIADTGRFATALKTGIFNEVEPYLNPVIISRGGIIAATIWTHPLPIEQK